MLSKRLSFHIADGASFGHRPPVNPQSPPDPPPPLWLVILVMMAGGYTLATVLMWAIN